MVETVYRVVRRADENFAVEVKRFGALPETAAGFPTEDAANRWIAQDKRLANTSEPFRTAAGRKWRQS